MESGQNFVVYGKISRTGPKDQAQNPPSCRTEGSPEERRQAHSMSSTGTAGRRGTAPAGGGGLKCSRSRLLFGRWWDGLGRMQQLKQGPHRTKVTLKSRRTRGSFRRGHPPPQATPSKYLSYLMAQEERLQLAFGPVVHGVGQQLHGEGVDPEEVPHKHHPLYALGRKDQQIQQKTPKQNSPTFVRPRAPPSGSAHL